MGSINIARREKREIGEDGITCDSLLVFFCFNFTDDYEPLDQLNLMVEIYCKSYVLHLVSTDPDSYIYIYIYIYTQEASKEDGMHVTTQDHAESTSRFGINRSGTWKRNKQEQHQLEGHRETHLQRRNSIGLFSLLCCLFI